MTPGMPEPISMVKSPLLKGAKKIEEDYSMFDEARDDELEDIIEEEIEDDSEDLAEQDEANPDMMLTSQEEREERKVRKEELRTLKTALITIKEKL